MILANITHALLPFLPEMGAFNGECEVIMYDAEEFHCLFALSYLLIVRYLYYQKGFFLMFIRPFICPFLFIGNQTFMLLEMPFFYAYLPFYSPFLNLNFAIAF